MQVIPPVRRSILRCYPTLVSSERYLVIIEIACGVN